mmetsp:Transcript_36290/g.87739  ORF Transcript_36290/g.87739 Transcript_36290/m.87739 type:complete len:502 (-) Transcript_36290:44-1549(-)
MLRPACTRLVSRHLPTLASGARSMSNGHPNPNITTSKDQMWYKMHNTWPVQVPLTTQMPGTPRVDEGVEAADPKTEITTLSNGVRVISETSSSIGASMALYFATGSRVETEATQGSSHFLQHLAFRASEEKSHFLTTREIEKIGGHTVAGASRDCIAYAGECLASNADRLLALMAESAMSPRLEDLDIANARELVMADVANQSKNGPGTVLDAMHAVAFSGRGLGAPLLCPAPTAQAMTGDTIAAYLQETMSPSRVIVSAVGVEHAKLVDMATSAFGSMKPAQLEPPAPAKYSGGDFYMPGPLDMGEVHICIGMEGLGCSDKDLLALATIQTMLGGGDSFSAGGPGKGLKSRIFVNVLYNQGVLSSSAVNVSYAETGLFGISATTTPDHTTVTVELMIKELKRLRTGVSQEELSRAVNMTRASLFLNLENNGIVCEDLGRQLMYYDKRHTGKELSDQLMKITADDLKRVSEKLLASTPVVAAYGDISCMPTYSQIVSALQG